MPSPLCDTRAVREQGAGRWAAGIWESREAVHNIVIPSQLWDTSTGTRAARGPGLNVGVTLEVTLNTFQSVLSCGV